MPAAQATLHEANPSESYDKHTVNAVKKAQRKLDQKQTGKVTRRTWVALLARGKQPLLKVGSTGDPVRRLQRALTAALGKRVKVDGALSQATERAVLALPAQGHLPRRASSRTRSGPGSTPGALRPQSQVSQTPVGSSSM